VIEPGLFLADHDETGSLFETEPELKSDALLASIQRVSVRLLGSQLVSELEVAALPAPDVLLAVTAQVIVCASSASTHT
jgi:hypothetical protein